ncbi:MAG TPA: hypothetical protein VI382_02870, partial [Candidatus Manganitrophaceae bacterium]|nr:hypothetical protein [Candidatus Manganitrophaceae bacterium]
GALYAGTAGSKIYRSEDGLRWREAARLGKNPEAVWSHWVRALIEFKGAFFAATEANGVYRSPDGKRWDPIPSFGKSGARGAAVHQGALYLGATGSGRIWKTADGKKWDEVLDLGEGYIASMAVLNGRLYAGISTGATPADVFRSSDGTVWEEVGDISPRTVEAMAEFNKALYAGTLTAPEARIWRTSGRRRSEIAVAEEETLAAGEKEGDFKETQTGYHLYETLKERRAGAARRLEHEWIIPIREEGRATLILRAHQSVDEKKNHFHLSWASGEAKEAPLASRFRSEEQNDYQLIDLGRVSPGPLRITVRSESPPDRPPAALFVDHLFVLMEEED